MEEDPYLARYKQDGFWNDPPFTHGTLLVDFGKENNKLVDEFNSNCPEIKKLRLIKFHQDHGELIKKFRKMADRKECLLIFDLVLNLALSTLRGEPKKLSLFLLQAIGLDLYTTKDFEQEVKEQKEMDLLVASCLKHFALDTTVNPIGDEATSKAGKSFVEQSNASDAAKQNAAKKPLAAKKRKAHEKTLKELEASKQPAQENAATKVVATSERKAKEALKREPKAPNQEEIVRLRRKVDHYKSLCLEKKKSDETIIVSPPGFMERAVGFVRSWLFTPGTKTLQGSAQPPLKRVKIETVDLTDEW
jgi:hypothetical protein